jgi:hypothetical protein
MIERFRHIWQILVLYAILLLSGTALLHYTSIALTIQLYVLTLSVMTLITIVAYVFSMIGVSKGESKQAVFLLIGLGGKFLLYLVFILILWATGKNLTKPFIIAFFILYLFLTFSLIRILYKVLKIN